MFLFSSEEALLVSSKLVLCTVNDETQKTNIEQNDTTVYIHPNTPIIGFDCLAKSTKLTKHKKDQDNLYIVENTLFYVNENFAIVTNEGGGEFQKFSEINISKVFKKFVVKKKKQVVKAQNNSQVTQTPFPFSLPTEQNQTIVTAISTTTVAPSAFAKTISKTFAIHNYFSLTNRITISQRKNAICYNKNSKPFQVKIKHCNRPPPALYC